MAIKKATKSQGSTHGKKLALKRERLADLSPKPGQADRLRGQSLVRCQTGPIGGSGTANHNETLVRLASR